MYSTKTKKLPTQKEVEEIDKVCGKMILDKRVISHSIPWSALWTLNCIVYSAVIGWIIVCGIDVLGGHSKHLRENISKIVKDKARIKCIIHNMQKSVLSSTAHITRKFKLNVQ